MRHCQTSSMRRESHAPRGASLFVALLPLLAAFPALSSAHCGHAYEACMNPGYIVNPSYSQKKPLSGDLIIAGAKCAGICAEKGYKIWTMSPKALCSCTETCADQNVVDGEGYFGVTYNCFQPPTGFYATLACTSNLKNRCSASKCMMGASCKNSGSMHKCCCSLKTPNPVYYQNKFTGCAT